MPADLEAQLRAYGQMFAAHIGTQNSADAMNRRHGEGNVKVLEPITAQERGRPRKGAWLAAAVFAVVVGVGITLGLVFGGGGESSKPVATAVGETVAEPVVDAAAWCALGNEVNRHIMATQDPEFGEPLTPTDWRQLLTDWVDTAPSELAEGNEIVAAELKKPPSDLIGGSDYSTGVNEIQAFRELHCETGEIPAL